MNRCCSKCGVTQPIENFPYKNKSKGTRSYWCRECRREYDKATRHNRYYNLRSRKSKEA